MRIPVYLVVAQWVLLFTLGALVIVMYRQLGRHLNITRQHPEMGPSAGSNAAAFDYERIGDSSLQRFVPGHGQPALIAFVGPTCPACEDLVTSLGVAHDADELAGTRTLLLISDPPSYLQISSAFRTTQLEIGRIVDHATIDLYRASVTPLAVAIDAVGVVRSAGPATRVEDVHAFVSASRLPPEDSTRLLPMLAEADRHAEHPSH